MVQYSSSELLLVSLCGSSGGCAAEAHVGTLLVEVVASVLDNEVSGSEGKEREEGEVVECAYQSIGLMTDSLDGSESGSWKFNLTGLETGGGDCHYCVIVSLCPVG